MKPNESGAANAKFDSIQALDGKYLSFVPASFITPPVLMMMPSKKGDGDGVITREEEEDEVIILQWCTLGDRYSVKLRGEHYSKG